VVIQRIFGFRAAFMVIPLRENSVSPDEPFGAGARRLMKEANSRRQQPTAVHLNIFLPDMRFTVVPITCY
jgi:hypothetical protein